MDGGTLVDFKFIIFENLNLPSSSYALVQFFKQEYGVYFCKSSGAAKAYLLLREHNCWLDWHRCLLFCFYFTVLSLNVSFRVLDNSHFWE